MPRKYSWGVKELDEKIGQIETGYITTIYGPTGSGKTTLAAYVPTAMIAKELKQEFGELPEKAKFLIMDTDHGYAVERGKQVWELNGLPLDEFDRHVVHLEFTTFEEQHNTIKGLEKTIEEKDWRPVLLALDPAIAIYRGQVLRTDLKYRASVLSVLTGKIDLQMSILRRLAVVYDAACTVTSWPPSPVGSMLGGAEPETPCLGGRQMGFLSKVMIELSIPQEGAPEREALLVKHRSKPVGDKAKFRLCDAGIEGV